MHGMKMRHAASSSACRPTTVPTRVAATAGGATVAGAVSAAAAARRAAAVRRRHQRSNGVRAASSPAAPAGAGTGDGVDLAAAAARLKSWFLERSSGSATTTLDPTVTPDGAITMVTRTPVAKGAPLLAVPRSLLMTADTARACPLCGPLIERADLDDWQALVLHLLVECRRTAAAGKAGTAGAAAQQQQEEEGGGSSEWAPYLALLSSSADLARHPLMWPEERARAWLAGSPMLRTFEARRAQVASDTAALVAAGANDLRLPAESGLGDPSARPLVTEASVAWAAAALVSRAFSLYLAPEEPDHGILPMEDFGSWDRGGRDVLALVPWADLLQHSSGAGDASVLAYDAELGAASLCAHRDYAEGDEVFDSYGPGLSPSDLLADYGFVDPGNSNFRYDAVPADIAKPRGTRNNALLQALARLQGEGSLLALGPDGPDTTGLTVLRASLASEAELVRAGWKMRASPSDVGAAARALGRLSRPDGAATEAAVLSALASYCGRALAAYSSSLADDEAELAALLGDESSGDESSGGGSGEEDTRRQRVQVLRALISEKRALTGSAAAVAKWQEALAAGTPVAELYGDDDDGGGGEW